MVQVYIHVSFNGGNQHFSKVRDDVTLKELKDLLHEINQRINHEDAMRVEYVWYHRPSFDSDGNLSFTWSELTNDDDVRSMFSIFVEPNMIPLEMDVTLLRSPEDILKSLIRSDEDV